MSLHTVVSDPNSFQEHIQSTLHSKPAEGDHTRDGGGTQAQQELLKGTIFACAPTGKAWHKMFGCSQLVLALAPGKKE